MVARFSKRGKNPGAIDSWLDSLGYFRKNVAYDETCLFRAVSEQLKYTQTHHEEIRKKCITYGKKWSKQFQHLVPKKRDWCERLKKLSLHMLVCGEIEVYLICKTFCIDIVMFNGAKREMQEIRCTPAYKTGKTIYVCKTSEDHYDAVYAKEHIQNAGFCQSIVYTTLYQDVFGVPNVPETVQKMLHNKEKSVTYSVDTNHNVEAIEGEDDEDYDEETFNECNMQLNYNGSNNLVAPFPFKVAKALDPDMYRNIEYDTWLEVRRELRLGDWYYGDDRLIHGTRCLVNNNGRDYLCYVQNIVKDENKCEVYVTDLATRWLVDYSDLRPENDATPWPVPYRFSKNTPLQIAPTAGLSDNDTKSLRKRREKKLASKMHDSNVLNLSKDLSDMSVGDFEGYPLLMQNAADASGGASAPTKNSSSSSTMEYSNNTSPTTPHGIDLLQWQQNASGSHDGYLPLNTPMTPSESPAFYPDPLQSPYYCNFNSEYSYPMMWQQSQYMLTPDSGLSNDEAAPYMDYNGNPQKVVYYRPESTVPLQTPPPPQSPKPYAPLTLSVNEKVMCSTPIIPTPQLNYYPMIYPLTPSSAPICYSNTPPPIQRPETVAPPPPPTPAIPVYNSVLDPMYIPSPSYMNASPYVSTPYMNPPPYLTPPAYHYSSTTPLAWYPSHVNSQGFVFPPPVNN